jgi:hypothetical protein
MLRGCLVGRHIGDRVDGLPGGLPAVGVDPVAMDLRGLRDVREVQAEAGDGQHTMRSIGRSVPSRRTKAFVEAARTASARVGARAARRSTASVT